MNLILGFILIHEPLSPLKVNRHGKSLRLCFCTLNVFTSWKLLIVLHFKISFPFKRQKVILWGIVLCLRMVLRAQATVLNRPPIQILCIPFLISEENEMKKLRMDEKSEEGQFLWLKVHFHFARYFWRSWKNKMSFSSTLVILMGDGVMRVAFMRNLHCGGALELLVKQEWLWVLEKSPYLCYSFSMWSLVYHWNYCLSPL